MKKILSNLPLIITVIVSIAIGILLGKAIDHTRSVSEIKTESIRYTKHGRYYINGTVITNDGNIWGYGADSISEKQPYDGMPVWVAFDDNGTPENIYDDIILGVVYDRETAIYDALEESLSQMETYSISRNGNIITIGK